MQYEAFYSDGRSAARRQVFVMLGADGLSIHDREGDLVARWPYRGLRLLEEIYVEEASGEEADRKEETRLVHRGMGDATLTVTGSGFLDAIEPFAGRGLGTHPLLRPTWGNVAILLGVLIAVALGLVLLLPGLADPLSDVVPESWERALGEKAVAELAAGHAFCEAPGGKEALQRLTAKIARQVPGGNSFHVRVIDAPQVNAFAAPGGYIVLLNGLIEAAETPEELAGVLAHEMAHEAERHPMKGLLRAMGVRLLLNALFGEVEALREAAGLLVVLSYTRADERTADRLAVVYLDRAGIRGDGLAAFFRRLEAQKGDAPTLPSILSSHPSGRERMDALGAERSGGAEQTGGAALSREKWLALRSICAK